MVPQFSNTMAPGFLDEILVLRLERYRKAAKH
jgi:hypothetical protein